jgi:hypothetical protein
MQVPPPPSQPVSKSPNVLMIVLGVVAVCSCCGIAVLAAVLFPVFEQAKIASKRTAALSNAKQLGTAMMIYAVDHDDRLPFADNWIDLTEPYAKNPSLYHSPGAPGPVGDQYGFAFRKELSRKHMVKIEDIQNTAMIFDTTLTGRNATSGLETLPRPGRYGGKNTIGFTDGSAKSINPADTHIFSLVK